MWSKCSKRVFVGVHRFKLAVITFNDSAKGRQNLLERLDLDCSKTSKKVLATHNKIRLDNARIKISEKCRKQRQRLDKSEKAKRMFHLIYVVDFPQN